MHINLKKTLTIVSGQTQTSAAADLSGYTLAGIYLPSTFDGTTLTLQTSPTLAGTYVNVQSAGADYSITTAASKYVPIENLAITAGIEFLKITAGTSQTGDTIITLSLREVV